MLRRQDVPGRKRTCNLPLGGESYIHLTTGTRFGPEIIKHKKAGACAPAFSDFAVSKTRLLELDVALGHDFLGPIVLRLDFFVEPFRRIAGRSRAVLFNRFHIPGVLPSNATPTPHSLYTLWT